MSTDDEPLVIDATGLRCPIPVSRLATAITEVEVGEVVTLLATDPASRVDVPVWCRLHRHRLVRTDEDERGWRYVVVRTR